jgi:hypothetical protein
MRFKASLVGTAIMLASATVSSSAMSMGGGFHGASRMNAVAPPVPARGDGIGLAGHSVTHAGVNYSLAGRNGPVPLKKKAGKLNGACYRSCTKTSMGDAFRTDQFCAYSCSLD